MKWLALLLCLCTLIACSGKPPAPTTVPAAASTGHVATPWDDMKKTEQRARDVQKTVDEQAEKQRQQVDAAER
jgi:hypothetical protein